MYKKCDIEEMLKKYLISKAQLEELDFKTNRNKVLLKYNGKIYRETDEEAIRELALKHPFINRLSDSLPPDVKYISSGSQFNILATLSLAFSIANLVSLPLL